MRPAPLSWFLLGVVLAVLVQGARGILADVRADRAERNALRVIGQVDSLARRSCVYFPPDTAGRAPVR